MKYFSRKIFLFYTQLASINPSLVLFAFITGYFIPFSKDFWKDFHCDCILHKLFLFLLEFYCILCWFWGFIYMLYLNTITFYFCLYYYYFTSYSMGSVYALITYKGWGISQCSSVFFFSWIIRMEKVFPHLSEATIPSSTLKYLGLLGCTNLKQSICLWKYSVSGALQYPSATGIHIVMRTEIWCLDWTF